MEKYWKAKAVKGLLNAADALKEALSGAHSARDEELFKTIYLKQTEIEELAESLIKD